MEDWRALEKTLARRLQGELTIGSGNKWQKGDVHSSKFLAEAKWRSPHLDLIEDWMCTVAKYADRKNKEPALAVCCNNYWTLVLITYDFWLTSEFRMADQPLTPVDCTGKKQKRLHSTGNYAYTTFNFDSAGVWIALPWDDFMLLSRGEQLDIDKELTCRKLTQMPRKKTEQQLEKQQALKNSKREKRRLWYQEQKARAKIRKQLT